MLVGTARDTINPQVGHHLGGYGDDYPCEGVHDDLTVTALYLHDGNSDAILLNYDLLGMPAVLVDRIRNSIAEKTAIPADRIFVACTHTHSGPVIREFRKDGPKLARLEYNDSLVRKSAAVAAAAKSNAEPCELYYNFAFAAENMNRRYNFPDRRSQYTPQNKQLAGTSTEFLDRELGIIAFRKKGTPNRYKSVIPIYTCHPLCVGNSSNLTSADYQGYLRKTIEETFAGCTVMSLTGCAGDHHPLMPESGFAQAEKMGRTLGSLALARIYDSIHVDYDTTLRTAWRDVALPAKDQRTADLMPEPIDRDNFNAMLKANADRPSEIATRIALLGIGPLLLACTPGEPVAELGAMIKWACPFLKTYPLFLATDSVGYIPTANQVLWGGYEVAVSPFAQGAGEKLVQHVVSTAWELVQKTPLTIPPRTREVIGYGGR
jgi:hypothetical protein